MISNIFLVAKREYLSRVKKISFWLSTLAFPLFFIIVVAVSGLSSAATDQFSELDLSEEGEPIIIQDESGLIAPADQLQLPPVVTIVSSDSEDFNKQTGIDQVEEGLATAFIYYPANVFETQQIDIYQQDQGLFGQNKFESFADSLLKQSAQLQIQDEEVLTALTANFGATITAYEEGEVIETGFESLIPVGISILLYLVLVMTGAGFMLQSVSEEKENRMIEVVLAAISGKELIWGKITGLVGVVFTQMTGLIGLTLVPALVFRDDLPIDIFSISIAPEQLLFGFLYIAIGFITLSAIMVGLAAAMPSYKDAQSFSGVFYIGAIFPLYFITILIADPAGQIATTFSYVPVFGPIILLIRNALGALSTLELALATLANIGYMVLALYLAFLLFEVGALLYNQKLSWENLKQRLF